MGLFLLVLFSDLVQSAAIDSWELWYKADEVVVSVMQFLANYGAG